VGQKTEQTLVAPPFNAYEGTSKKEYKSIANKKKGLIKRRIGGGFTRRSEGKVEVESPGKKQSVNTSKNFFRGGPYGLTGDDRGGELTRNFPSLRRLRLRFGRSVREKRRKRVRT